MKRFGLVVLAAVVGLVLASVIHSHSADATSSPLARMAPAPFVSPAPPAPNLPTKVTLAGTASAGTTLATAGQCLRISCNVDCAYRVTTGGSTATTDDNQLPAATPERLCMGVLQNTITFYSATAGAAYVATTVP